MRDDLRSWIARCAALVVVLGVACLLLVGVELALRLTDLGGDLRHDTRAGFSKLSSAFEPAVRSDGTRVYRYVYAEGDFRFREFLAQKPAGGFRVFVVGASSAAGVPYSPAESFSGWLSRRLEAELPDVPVEVVNAATSSFATRRLLIRTRELARHDPDLLIIYSGHAEIWENRYYAELIGMEPWLFALWEQVRSTRLFALASVLLDPTLNSELDARRADERKQMFAVLSDASPEEFREAEARYRANLEAMIESMRGVGAEVMLLTISQNFADWEPGGSSHRPALPDSELARWNQLVAEGDRLAPRDCGGALHSWQRALEIDDEFAALHFSMANCYRELLRFDEAQRSYVRASDLDRAYHGAPTRYNEIVRELALAHDTPYVDAYGVLLRASGNGIVGDNLFADLAHPNIRAHQLIGEAVADELLRRGIPVGREQWQRGAYREIDVAEVYESHPDLRRQEHLVRALSCQLAQRHSCVTREVEAALAMNPDDVAVQRFLRSAQRLERSREQRARGDR
jgi:lysophospholipase L1-like esterase